MKTRTYFLILLTAIGLVFPIHPINAYEKTEAVTLQLKWYHQFQFAGFYAAIEKGFYAEEGLDVTLRERNSATDHIEDVFKGKAQYGVADAGLALSRLQGKPAVLLAQIFQHSPLVFLSLKKSNIMTPFELRDKSIMIDKNFYKYPCLNALIIQTLGWIDKVSRIPETYHNIDLAEGKTDVMVAYSTDQPFWFKERGIDINIIDPRDYGIDFYGDNLFTTEKEIREFPQRVEKMIRATKKGWLYALQHKDEIVDLIIEKYNTQKFTREHLVFEAEETEKMIIPRFIDIGHFELSRFQKIIEIYNQLSLTDVTRIDKGFFYKRDRSDLIQKEWEMPIVSVLPAQGRFDQTKFPLQSLGLLFICITVILTIIWLVKGRPRQLSIQATLSLVAFVYSTLIVSSVIFTTMLLRGENQHHDKDILHAESMNMAFELKQSSDDLTRFARLYAVTGDPKYEHFFQTIIAIRDGRQAHPNSFTPAYWDYVAAGVVDLDQDGEMYSIEQRMTDIGLTNEEKAKLSEAKRQSDTLANLEKIAMNAVKGLFKDADGGFTIKGEPDMAMARAILYGKEYLNAKAMVMKPIDQFFFLLEMRTGNELNLLNHRNQAFLLAITGLIGITIGFSIYVFFLLKRRITLPLALLKKGAQAVEGGDYSHLVDLRSKDEVGVLAKAFNEMASNIREYISRLNATIESTTDGILVVGLDQKVTSYNQRFLEIWDIEPELAETLDDNALLDAILSQVEDSEIFLSRIEYLYANPGEEDFDTILLRSGQILERYSKPQQLGDRIVGRVWSFRDVTASRNDELMLRRNEQRLKQAQSMAQLGNWELDLLTDTLSWSDEIYRIFGFQPQAFAANYEAFLDGVHSDDRRIVDKTYSESLERKDDGYEIEHRIVRKDTDEVRYVFERCEHEKDASGNIIRSKGMVQDITDRKLTEEKLRKLSQAVQQSPVSIVITDADGTIEYVNPKFVEVTGYTTEEAVGQNPSILSSGEQPPEFYREMWETIKSGRVWQGEFHNRKKNGQSYWESASISPILNAQGKVTHYVAVKEDITKRKKTEDELHKAKEIAEAATLAKSEFLANMSHEIRTPMNAILGFLELVLEDKALSKFQRAHLTTAQNSANSLLGLINDILDISKLESGKFTIEQHPFKLFQLVKEIQATMETAAQKKGLKLEFDIQSSLSGLFMGDPLRLRQIIINLVGNAIKFTQKGGVSVRIMPAEKKGQLYFMIKDTGVGIPADRLGQIFDSFTQADTSTTRKFGGTGLGTSISKKLVELLGGRIWVESEEGKGSIFHFTINLPSTDQVPEDTDLFIVPGKAVLPGSRCGFKILLVEDVDANVDLAQIRLEQQGHKVTIAWNGREAVDAVLQDEFDVILMDINMPEMDGLEATRRIRKLEIDTGKHVPIIAMTAAVMEEETKRYFETGMDRVVAKPINFGKLYTVMEEVVPKGVGKMNTEIKNSAGLPVGLEFPRLEGIDTKRGLQIWQNPQVYAKALLGFSHNYSNAAKELTRLLDKGQIDIAYQIVHALKGVAGNLAITKVADTVIPMDTALRKKRINDVKEHLFTLAADLKTVIDSIGRLDGIYDQDGKEKSDKKMDITHLKDIFSKMLAAFAQLNPYVIEPFIAELKMYFAQDQLNPIVEYIERFEFEGAKQETIKLAETLKIEL